MDPGQPLTPKVIEEHFKMEAKSVSQRRAFMDADSNAGKNLASETSDSDSFSSSHQHSHHVKSHCSVLASGASIRS